MNKGVKSLKFKNCMEDFVLNQLDAVITINQGVCNCKQCRHDIVAMALTHLPAHYAVSSRGEVYTRVKAQEQQFNVDVITAITDAINVVKKYPHHEESE